MAFCSGVGVKIPPAGPASRGLAARARKNAPKPPNTRARKPAEVAMAGVRLAHRVRAMSRDRRAMAVDRMTRRTAMSSRPKVNQVPRTSASPTSAASRRSGARRWKNRSTPT